MRIGLSFGDPALDGAFRLSDFLYAHQDDGFEPIIIGSEPVYTAALSRTHPELIDRYPVYTVPIGTVVRGEASKASGENSVKAIKAACRLLGLGKIDALLIDGLNRTSLSLFDSGKPDLPQLLSAVFPGASLKTSLYLSSGAVTLYKGLPGVILEGSFEDCLSVLKTIEI